MLFPVMINRGGGLGCHRRARPESLVVVLLDRGRRRQPLLQSATGAATVCAPQELLVLYGAWTAITVVKQD